MNELIEQILADFTVNGQSIAVAFAYYHGHGEPYIVYSQMNADGSLTGDDKLIGYVDYYDFDVYSKGNYLPIFDSLREKLEAYDFVWQPSLSSGDLYDPDTGYYHKTLNFAIAR